MTQVQAIFSPVSFTGPADSNSHRTRHLRLSTELQYLAERRALQNTNPLDELKHTNTNLLTLKDGDRLQLWQRLSTPDYCGILHAAAVTLHTRLLRNTAAVAVILHTRLLRNTALCDSDFVYQITAEYCTLRQRLCTPDYFGILHAAAETLHSTLLRNTPRLTSKLLLLLSLFFRSLF